MRAPESSGTLFRLGYRLALLPAALSGVFSALSVYLAGSSLTVSVASGLLVMVGVLAAAYLLAARLLRKRLDRLESIIFKSSRSKFKLLQNKPEKDELDLLIHEAEQARNAIHKEFEQMDQTENYRKEFIGDISHELKTPIFTVQGYLETLLDGALEDPAVNRKFLENAMKNTARLTNLTKDLMEISKLETGELRPNMQLVPLNSVINEVLETLQYKADQSGITLEFKKSRSNIFAIADRNQLRQVLINLVENAIKYNRPDGKVTIHTDIYSLNPSKVIVTVRDTGIGIEKEDIKRVTERFFRVDKSRSREQGGTGLGLAIVKHILESHHEQLQIDSTPGEGSVFQFTLKNADHHHERTPSPE
ncbi:ATP-binding protein [Balneolales bacterium ANBcel1]|nr:ATP-binding protein [Balneolales bacterium ANBcel1]